MAPEDPIADRLLDAALEIIASRGWRALATAELAAAADVSPAEVYRRYPAKPDLLAALLARTDLAVLAGPAVDLTEPPRDRLFDVLMRRFDALQPHRDAYLRLMRELPLDPVAMLVFLPRFARGMAWMVEAAGLSSAGAAGFVRCQGIAAIYLQALRVWARDDSADMARTMAAVDQGLTRADSLVGRLPGFGAAPPPATGAAATAATEAADPSHDDRVPD